MRQAFTCSLLEARPGSLAELRRCLEGWRIDCRPAALIRELDLLRPIYRSTAAYGHFGRNEPNFTWERTNKAAELRESARSQVAA